jgi:hypothetical protein
MLKNDFESQNFAIFEDIVHNFGRYDALRPEGSENIPILFQGADLDFSIKLCIRPHKHLLEINIFSLNDVIIRPTKIMKNLLKDCKILTFIVLFQHQRLTESF